MFNHRLVQSALLSSVFCTMSWAQAPIASTPVPDSQRESIEAIDKKVEALASEVERIKLGNDVLPPMVNGKFGLAPAASKVYQVKQGVSIGGYGEIIYQHFDSAKDDIADALRLITYVGYKFSDQFVFNSEIEFEHGSTELEGSVSAEFAYIDYLWKNSLNVRAGLVLVPMGFINELHEPTTFLGVGRPKTERVILPSTWRDVGIGIFGETKNWSYRTYVVNSLDAVGNGPSNATGFDASGIRQGRQNGSKARANDFAWVGRADYIGFEGLLAGVSLYAGKTGQNQKLAGNEIAAWLTVTEGHVDYKYKGLQFRGLLAYSHLSDSFSINTAKGLATTGVASDMMGGYTELGYNLFFSKKSKHELVPFFRYEHVNTQLAVPSSFVKNEVLKENIYTLGLNYKPMNQLVAKFDYQWNTNAATRKLDQINLGIGYMF